MKLDIFSFSMAILGIMISVYLYVVANLQIALVPIVLLLSGITFFYILSPSDVEQELEEAFKTKNLLFTGLALVSFSVFSFFLRFLPLSVSQLSIFDAMLLGILMAVAEEFFFRGAITQYFATRFNETAAVFFSGLIFAVYHVAVYSQNITSLFYALLAGIVLSWIFLRTKSLTPTILAHVINNIIAVV
jgi:membrane protease YdiL (CAAX protease family)